jgi:hypothetical protein
MEDLLKTYLTSLVKNESGLMNTKLRDCLCKEAEKIFKTSAFYKLPLASMSVDNAVDVVINEIVQSSSYKDDSHVFLHEHRKILKEKLWTPSLEYEMTLPPSNFHLHLLHTLGPEWRHVINHYPIPIVVGQPFQLRESMTEHSWDTFPSSVGDFNESNVWTRSIDGKWSRISSSEEVAEPIEFNGAITYQNCPSSKNVLALFHKSVKLGRLGGKVFGEFAHDIDQPDFLDCFVLSTGVVIVKIGVRNVMTGGLKDEMSFSFRYGKSDYDCVPYSLTKEEESEIQTYYHEQHTMKDMTCTLSVVNSINGGSPYINHDFKKYFQSKDSMCLGIVCGVVGNASGFALAFCDGTIKTNLRTLKLNRAITHILYQV